jgi:hypothetical protein
MHEHGCRCEARNKIMEMAVDTVRRDDGHGLFDIFNCLPIDRMILQYVILIALLALASGYLVLRLKRTFSSKRGGCSADCGCAGKEVRASLGAMNPK